jgi:hypothetical protein
MLDEALASRIKALVSLNFRCSVVLHEERAALRCVSDAEVG